MAWLAIDQMAGWKLSLITYLPVRIPVGIGTLAKFLLRLLLILGSFGGLLWRLFGVAVGRDMLAFLGEWHRA